MRPLDTTKTRMSIEIDQQMRAFLKKGGTIEGLPSPGDGHILRDTYTIKQRSNDEYAAKGKYKIQLKGTK